MILNSTMNLTEKKSRSCFLVKSLFFASFSCSCGQCNFDSGSGSNLESTIFKAPKKKRQAAYIFSPACPQKITTVTDWNYFKNHRLFGRWCHLHVPFLFWVFLIFSDFWDSRRSLKNLVGLRFECQSNPTTAPWTHHWTESADRFQRDKNTHPLKKLSIWQWKTNHERKFVSPIKSYRWFSSQLR